VSNSYMLKMIGAAIRPASNVRVHFTREVFDHSLTSQTPSEVDKQLLLPVFEYELTLSERGWMYLETMKGGGCKKHEEDREIRKTFHSDGLLPKQWRRELYLRRRDLHQGILDGYFPGVWPRLSDFWAGFVGYNVYSNFPINVNDGFYSADRPNVRYSHERREKSRVVRAQYLFPDGRVNFESIHDIKQFPNGVWFQMGYDMMRYADPETGREARYRHCVRVTDVEFDIEIDAKTFELPEGVDAITRAT
jgi:hypothetical protein